MSTERLNAIVTGAGGHLGGIIGAALVDAGISTVGWDVQQPRNALSFPVETCDVADHDSVDHAIALLKGQVSEVHVLVNAAGWIANAPLINLLNRKDPCHSIEMWQRCITANLTSTFVASRAVASWMVAKRTRGVIVNISSIAARGNAGQTAYSAAKAGVEAMTAVWAKELGPMGIRVVAIAPGFIDTPSTRDAVSEARLSDLAAMTPLRKLGSGQAVADAVLHAIHNDYITGSVIAIDGGLRL